MVITVCLGSSCHHKGSGKLIDGLNDLMRNYQLEKQWELKGAFCLGHCAEGINLLVDDERKSFPTVEEAMTFFHELIHSSRGK